MADESNRLAAVPIWSDAVRRLRDLAGQMTAAAQAVAVAGARATPPVLAEPLAGYTNQLLAISAALTTPLKRLVDEQGRLVEMMAEWAEEHRRLSEQVADWADEQRRLSEQMLELARPLLDQSAMLESLQAQWSTRSGDGGPLRPGMGSTASARPTKQSSAKKSSPQKSSAKKPATSSSTKRAPSKKAASPRR